MNKLKKHSTEIWAYLVLSDKDTLRLHDFFENIIGIDKKFLVKNMHLTVYHSRREMPKVEPIMQPANITVPVNNLRFMVMAPGGENPRPELEPGKRKIGLRIQKQSPCIEDIRFYRSLLIEHETRGVLGSRNRSSNTHNAFGARHFQPHITILKAGNNIDRDLTKAGNRLREMIDELHFDQFVINIIKNENMK